jgi:branched-subunit amino acid transport protein AzlD
MALTKAGGAIGHKWFEASTIVEMIKLITPLGMLFTVAMMAVLAVYAFWTSHVDRSWLYFGLGIVSIAACIGVALLRAWSQYPVYLLSAAFVAAWFHSVYTGVAAGYFDFFFSSRLVAAKTLLPGFTLVVLSVAASWIAFRHFRRRRHSH